MDGGLRTGDRTIRRLVAFDRPKMRARLSSSKWVCARSPGLEPSGHHRGAFVPAVLVVGGKDRGISAEPGNVPAASHSRVAECRSGRGAVAIAVSPVDTLVWTFRARP